MIFLPIAPLTRLISHTRHSLLFHLHKPTHVAHKTHRLLLFRLSSPGAIPDYYSMEQKCPHLGADLGSAGMSYTKALGGWVKREGFREEERGKCQKQLAS